MRKAPAKYAMHTKKIDGQSEKFRFLGTYEFTEQPSACGAPIAIDRPLSDAPNVTDFHD